MKPFTANLVTKLDIPGYTLAEDFLLNIIRALHQQGNLNGDCVKAIMQSCSDEAAAEEVIEKMAQQYSEACTENPEAVA